MNALRRQHKIDEGRSQDFRTLRILLLETTGGIVFKGLRAGGLWVPEISLKDFGVQI